MATFIKDEFEPSKDGGLTPHTGGAWLKSGTCLDLASSLMGPGEPRQDEPPPLCAYCGKPFEAGQGGIVRTEGDFARGRWWHLDCCDKDPSGPVHVVNGPSAEEKR